MSKCDNCIYTYPQYFDLCSFPHLMAIGGGSCSCFYPRPVDSIQVERCLLCGGPNNQEHKNKQFCSECEEKYCLPKPNEYCFEVGV